MMGDIDLALNHLPEAQAAYTDYQSAYPTASPDDVAVGLAGIDLANNDPASAGQKIAPILDQALKQRAPSGATAALYGRAFLISGKIGEHTGDYSGALEDYLRAAVVFPEDRVAAASAQTAADSLRKSHSVTVQ
jgi:tetratricopeptide (TPR) repeat protein